MPVFEEVRSFLDAAATVLITVREKNMREGVQLEE